MITAESTSNRILVNISDNAPSNEFILQRAFYKNRTWVTYTDSGFVLADETTEPLYVHAGDFVDSFDLTDGLYEYRYIEKDTEIIDGSEYIYSRFVKFGNPDCIGYTFGNYHAPEGEWGMAITPDDLRYTYLWGTDFKATNGAEYSDEQITFFIEQSLAYLERELNLTIKKKSIASQAKDRGLVKGTEYDIEEPLYDYAARKIQRYGMIQTLQRPIIDVTRCTLVNRSGSDTDIINDITIDRRRGVLKLLKRPYLLNDTMRGLATAACMYGQETFNHHMFYSIDYTAGYESCDDIPMDLREIIAKVAAVSLLNIIGDGLMSGFSSSSLSLDGMSESFSSTQSATSSYFGARISVYKDDIKTYIEQNKFKFGFMTIDSL